MYEYKIYATIRACVVHQMYSINMYNMIESFLLYHVPTRILDVVNAKLLYICKCLSDNCYLSMYS